MVRQPRWHAYWFLWLEIYWMDNSAPSGRVDIPSICICCRNLHSRSQWWLTCMKLKANTCVRHGFRAVQYDFCHCNGVDFWAGAWQMMCCRMWRRSIELRQESLVVNPLQWSKLHHLSEACMTSWGCGWMEIMVDERAFVFETTSVTYATHQHQQWSHWVVQSEPSLFGWYYTI